MRERILLRNGQQAVTMHEVTDLVAVRAEDMPGREGMVLVRGTRPYADKNKKKDPLAVTVESFAPEIPRDQIRAFEKAGWVFVPRSRIAVGKRGASVFLERGERLALATDKAVVKLYDKERHGVGPKDVLAKYGCQVLKEFSFAPRTFRVAVAEQEGRDTLDVTNQLMEDGVAEYAEPELIEMIGGR